MGRHDLRYRAAGVVGHQIDAGQVQRLAEVLDHRGQPGQGEVLAGPDRRAPVQRQVQGNAPVLIFQRADDVTPQQPAGAHAMHEQRRAAGADVGVADRPGLRVSRLPVAVVLCQVHVCLRSVARLRSMHHRACRTALAAC